MRSAIRIRLVLPNSNAPLFSGAFLFVDKPFEAPDSSRSRVDNVQRSEWGPKGELAGWRIIRLVLPNFLIKTAAYG